MAKTPDPTAVLRRNRAAALRTADEVGQDRLLKILKRSADDLNRRLERAVGLKGPGTQSFTAEQLRISLLQVADVVATMNVQMATAILGTGQIAADLAFKGEIAYMKAAEQKYRGINARLPIREASMLDRVRNGTESSILHRISTDPEHPGRPGVLQRYGGATIAKFEEALQQRFLARQPWADVRNALTAESPFLQGAPKYWAERIVRTECLTGDTPVSGAVVRAAFRRWYEGDVVEIVTERGRKFTTTPNHPMLSTRAWVASGELREGDDLVCYRGQQDASSPGYKNVAAPPATVAEVFDTLSAVGIRERRRTTEPDFHGDGRDSEVDISRTDGVLCVGRYAPIFQPLAERIFTPTNDVLKASFCPKCTRLLSIDQQACGCGGPAIDAGFLQAFLACSVALNDLIVREIAAPGVPQGVKAIDRGFVETALNPLLLKMLGQTTRTYSSEFRSRFQADSADIEFDRVVKIRVRRFVGHVFNLSTTDGYFAINGAYTGNTMNAYNRAGWETTRAVDETLGDVVKILCATFDDRTAADSYAVHGQIRRPAEAFESWFGKYQHPPNRPNDREVVVSHRVSWPIPDELRPRSDGEVAARWAYEGRKGAMPARPLMSTVDRELFGKEKPPPVTQTTEAETSAIPADVQGMTTPQAALFMK